MIDQKPFQVKLIKEYVCTEVMLTTFDDVAQIEQIIKSDDNLKQHKHHVYGLPLAKKKLLSIKALDSEGNVIARYSPIGLGRDLED